MLSYYVMWRYYDYYVKLLCYAMRLSYVVAYHVVILCVVKLCYATMLWYVMLCKWSYIMLFCYITRRAIVLCSAVMLCYHTCITYVIWYYNVMAGLLGQLILCNLLLRSQPHWVSLHVQNRHRWERVCVCACMCVWRRRWSTLWFQPQYSSCYYYYYLRVY